MARPKSYAETDVLEAAMRLFWRKGYVATSMADIYAATGLKPGNLYATFTDKETLFQRAFDTYAAHFRASLPVGLTGRAAIEAWLDTQVALATGDPERKGCLIINSITEKDVHSDETQALVAARLAEITAFFTAQLAVMPESVAEDRDGDAATLTGAVVAIMALGRAGAPDATIAAVAAHAKRVGRERI